MMKQLAKVRTIRFIGIIILLMSLPKVSSGQAKRGITGDWQIIVDFKDRQMSSIMSLSKDEEGKLKGKLIN